MKKPQVKLVGEDGNAFSILGRCSRSFKKSGLPQEWWDKFHAEATSGDYDHLLQTVMKYFEVDGEDEEKEEEEENDDE